MNLISLTLIILLSSCATNHIPDSIKVEKDEYEKVTVQTALDLAFTSYLKACTDFNKKEGRSGFFETCRDLGKKHVKENILFILEQ
ncbi:MAG: hypothetical protein KC493_06850 [Bacteriovoracaceae bacterium]|nr:hypothetical protein [Bacteriovoracaceae bacterium]